MRLLFKITDHWTKNPVNVVFFDNVVLARRYIGPIRRNGAPSPSAPFSIQHSAFFQRPQLSLSILSTLQYPPILCAVIQVGAHYIYERRWIAITNCSRPTRTKAQNAPSANWSKGISTLCIRRLCASPKGTRRKLRTSPRRSL